MISRALANSLIITAAFGGILAAVATQTKLLDNQSSTPRERCYGIARAGHNECGTPKHSCAGMAEKDGDPQEWIMVQKGLCERITGGSLEIPK